MRRLLLLALAAARGVASAQQGPTVVPLPSARRLAADSTVQSLLAEALGAALGAPAGQRAGLVNGVGRAQVRARDFAGAERTLSLGERATTADVARQLGQSLTFVWLDRADLATRLVCALRSSDRGDEALAVVRRMPAGDDREWQLAHLASLTARARLSSADSLARRRGDTPRLWNDALALARDVTLPEAKLDALLAVAEAAADSTTRRDVAFAAYDEARRIRLADTDRRASRDAMLAELAIRLGRAADARALFGELSNAEDLEYVFGAAAAVRNASLVRALAPRTIAAGRAIGDRAARFAYLSQVRESLIRAAGNGVADDLLPERVVGLSPEGPRRISRDSALAASNDPRDAANRAESRGDFAAIRREVGRLPIVDPAARRAKLWSDLAWSTYSMYRDTAAAYLTLAREALLASRADAATRDQTAEEIADRQFWIADDEGGLTTLNLIGDPNVANAAISNWGGSTASSLTADRLRAYADRVRDPRARDAVLLRVITGYLAIRDANAAQLERARRLADSIATAPIAIQGRLAVALIFVQRGDSARARAELTSLLAEPSLGDGEAVARIVGPLVAEGGLAEATAWARTGVPARRSRRLVTVADALRSSLDARFNRFAPDMLSNGPDSCRDIF